MRAKEVLKEILDRALKKDELALTLPSPKQFPPIAFEIPKNEDHGDYSSNIALTLAPHLKQSPRDIAKKLLDSFEDQRSVLKDVTVA